MSGEGNTRQQCYQQKVSTSTLRVSMYHISNAHTHRVSVQFRSPHVIGIADDARTTEAKTVARDNSTPIAEKSKTSINTHITNVKLNRSSKVQDTLTSCNIAHKDGTNRPTLDQHSSAPRPAETSPAAAAAAQRRTLSPDLRHDSATTTACTSVCRKESTHFGSCRHGDKHQKNWRWPANRNRKPVEIIRSNQASLTITGLARRDMASDNQRQGSEVGEAV